MYDIAIIGGGPAGISAAINASVLNKNFIWYAAAPSRKVQRAELIKNYPGLPEISGKQLEWALSNHAASMGIEVCRKLVTGIYPDERHFTLIAGSDCAEAKTVILCPGVQAAEPIAGEENFLGRGVSYCATCDGSLYRGKKIAVVCTDGAFEGEINYLLGLAKEGIIVPLYKNCGISAPNARIVVKRPCEIAGDSRVRQLKFRDGAEDVDGVFILRGSVAPTTLLHGLETRDGHIVVDRACACNIAGVFAAGDCTGRPYQYAKAVGEGNVALHSAAEYLDKLA